MRTVAQLDEAINKLMAACKVAEGAQLMPIKLDAQKPLARRFHWQAYVSRISYRWHVLLPFTRCTTVVFRDPADFRFCPSSHARLLRRSDRQRHGVAGSCIRQEAGLQHRLIRPRHIHGSAFRWGARGPSARNPGV